jgi:hypothetical protein
VEILRNFLRTTEPSEFDPEERRALLRGAHLTRR